MAQIQTATEMMGEHEGARGPSTTRKTPAAGAAGSRAFLSAA